MMIHGLVFFIHVLITLALMTVYNNPMKDLGLEGPMVLDIIIFSCIGMIYFMWQDREWNDGLFWGRKRK